MWIYEKKLQYPVRVYKKDVKMAKYLMAQYGGPLLKFCCHNNLNVTSAIPPSSAR